jgi:hypothetical protein
MHGRDFLTIAWAVAERISACGRRLIHHRKPIGAA